MQLKDLLRWSQPVPPCFVKSFPRFPFTESQSSLQQSVSKRFHPHHPPFVKRYSTPFQSHHPSPILSISFLFPFMCTLVCLPLCVYFNVFFFFVFFLSIVCFTVLRYQFVCLSCVGSSALVCMLSSFSLSLSIVCYTVLRYQCEFVCLSH